LTIKSSDVYEKVIIFRRYVAYMLMKTPHSKLEYGEKVLIALNHNHSIYNK